MPAYNRIVYHKEDLDRFLIFLKKHNGNLTLASRSAGFRGGRNTAIALMEKYAWFAEKVEEVIEELFDEIESGMIKDAKKGSGPDRRFLLKYHKSGRKRGYGERTEVTGKNGAPISWTQVAEAK